MEHTGIAAGTPSALSKGSELQRAAHDSARHAGHVEAGRTAEDAAGIGTTRGDENETSDRDADGRRLWEVTLGETPRRIDADVPGGCGAKDPTGQSGTQLDLAG